MFRKFDNNVLKNVATTFRKKGPIFLKKIMDFQKSVLNPLQVSKFCSDFS